MTLDLTDNTDFAPVEVGDALDAIVGHRIAEASVRRLIEVIARYLRAQLS